MWHKLTSEIWPQDNHNQDYQFFILDYKFSILGQTYRPDSFYVCDCYSIFCWIFFTCTNATCVGFTLWPQLYVPGINYHGKLASDIVEHHDNAYIPWQDFMYCIVGSLAIILFTLFTCNYHIYKWGTTLELDYQEKAQKYFFNPNRIRFC